MQSVPGNDLQPNLPLCGAIIDLSDFVPSLASGKKTTMLNDISWSPRYAKDQQGKYAVIHEKRKPSLQKKKKKGRI